MSGSPQRLSPKGTVPSLESQRGYLLITVVVTLFLVASIALLLNYDSAISANASSGELEAVEVNYVAQAGLTHAQWLANNSGCGEDVVVTNKPFGVNQYSASVSMATPGTVPTTLTLNADRDAFVNEKTPTQNYGSAAQLDVKAHSNQSLRSLYHFDLLSIPSTKTITNAVVRLFVVNPDAEGQVRLHRVVSDWQENTVTWDNVAADYSEVVADIPINPPSGQFIDLNITGLVQLWVRGVVPNHGLVLLGSANDSLSSYTSKEYGNVSQRPVLIVTHTDQPAISPGVIQSVGTLANGVNRTLTRNDVPIYNAASPITIGLQPGATGKDTFIEGDGGHQAHNKGDDKALKTNSESGNEYRSLLQFDLSAVPFGAKLLNSELQLNIDASSGAADTVDIHRLTNAWSEGDVTWISRDAANSWNNPGGDYDATIAASFVASGIGLVTVDITSMTQSWVDGSADNFGAILLSRSAAGNNEKNYTSGDEDGDPALRPKLTITYACQCGSVCVVPRGSGNVLLVVADPTSLTSVEDHKKNLMESWGYTVNVIDDDAPQATFDSDIAANGVVYISASVSSGAVGNKLSNASIGIVNEEGALDDELGFSSTQVIPVPVGDSLDVIDTNHYITGIFAAGPLDIYTADMGGHAAAGTLAAGLRPLANWGSSPGLAILEEGADLGGSVSGEKAAGPRVLVPFGQDNTHDWSKFSNNGHLLMQRSLAWAMTKKNGLRVLFVVGIDTALQTRDTARRDLFQSWGHAVTIIDDGATVAEFDAALAINDVVYVGGTVVAGTLDTKLNATSVGIVNEVAGQLDDFGFHGNAFANTVTNNLFTATDADHYISEPFGGSGVTHSTTTISMPVASTPLAPDLGKVAEIGALTWAIPVLDTGTERWDATPSPGRRVHLAFGEAEVSQLTPDGETLMKRSIEWAGGANNTVATLLFVVDDPANLSAAESDRIALVESWGYAVNIIDDSDSQAAFDAAVANSDVVYVPDTITASAVGNKMTAATIGIVNEAIDLKEILGFAGSHASSSRDEIDIIDNSHSITAGFALGLTTITTSSQPFTYFFTDTAPGKQILAETSHLGPQYKPSFLTLESGAELWGGGTAAGRRVQLPWGDGSFDINALNSPGLMLLQRSLEWGVGGGGGGTYLDEFNAVAYSGNDGTLDWSNDWQELGESDGPGSGIARVVSNARCITTNCLRVGHSDIEDQPTKGVVREADLSDAVTANFSYDFDAQNIDNDGIVYVEISADGGAGWTTLATHGVFDGAGAASYDITPYIAANTQIRFTIIGKYSMYLFVDNVRIDVGGGSDDTLAFSTDGDAEIGGLSFLNKDIVEYNVPGDSATLLLDSIAAGLSDSIDAVHILANGNIVLSTKGSATLGGLSFMSEDLIEYDPVADMATMYMQADAHFNSKKNITSLHILTNGNVVLSTDGSATLGGLSFGEFDLVEYDPSTGVASIFFDGEATTLAKKITALHILENGHIVLTTDGVASLGGLVFDADQLAEYDPVTDTATLYFDGDSSFSTVSEKIRSLHIGTGSGGGGGGGGGAGGCDGTFRDEFNAVSYAGSDGTQSWATNWLEINENGDVSSGDERVDNNDSNYHLQVRDNDGGGEGVQREADLSAYASATFSFEYRRDGFDDANDYVMVHVSSDGGSNWTELDRFLGPGTDSSYVSKSYDISAHTSSTTRIRFLTSPDHGSGDEMYIDNVEIAASGCANP